MESSKQPPSTTLSSPGSLLKTHYLSIISVLFAFIFCSGIILYAHFSGDIRISIGEPAPFDVFANANVSVIDEDATNEEIRLAINDVKALYVFDADAKIRTQKNINDLLSYLDRATTNGFSSEKKYQFLKNSYGPLLSDETIKAASNLNRVEIANASRVSDSTVSYFMDSQIVEEILASKKADIEADIQGRVDLNSGEKAVLSEVLPVYLESNYFLDKDGTAELQRQAADKVKPIQLSKIGGERVVEKGKIVTTADYEILEKLGLINVNYNARHALGYILAVLVVFILIIVYLYLYEKKVLFSGEKVAAICLVVIFGMVASKFAFDYGSPYLMPITAAAMLTTILFNLRMAVVIGASSVLLVAVMVDADQPFLFTFLIGVGLSVFLLRDLKSRTGFVLSVAILTVAFGLLAFISNLQTDLILSEVLAIAGWAAIGGMISAILTLGMLPFFEHFFNFTTDLRLLDLINLNHPLLKELALEAPGTYSHSLVVGNISENAAQEIGANPLLAKAGGYFHDIGKMKKADHFIENLSFRGNPHDHKDPEISKMLITSHVQDGIKLASRSKLPPEVIDIIAQHHGCSIVKYFYNKAKKHEDSSSGVVIKESDFRYPCKKPNTKEAAIVMIADIFEATARTFNKLTPTKLEHLGQKVLDDLEDDDQLSDSNLSISEMGLIVSSLRRSILAQHHSRVEYPVESTNEMMSGVDESLQERMPESGVKRS